MRLGSGVRFTLVAAGAAVGVLLVSGCAPVAAPAPTVTVMMTATPTPMPTSTVVVPKPTQTVYAQEPAPVVTITPNDVPVIPETSYARDGGAITGASGAPVLDDAGNPSSYTVIQGDDFFDIAQRFDIPVQQLLKMNPKVTGSGNAVYIGQRIELNADVLG